MRLIREEVLCAARSRTHWFTVVREGGCFQAPLRNRPGRPSPEIVRSRVILLCVVSSSEFLRSKSRSDLPCGRRALLPGFRPSSRHHQVRPLDARNFQSPLRSVLRLSQPLDGLLRTLTPQACFIPQPRSGPISIKGFSLDAATLPRRKELPPCRWGMVTHRTKFGARNHIPRLRGLFPHRAAFLRSGD
jgi:hypothetical protein